MDWVYKLPENIWQWLLSLQDSQYPGRFKFCRQGSLYRPSADTGLFTSCFALKICYQLNKIGEVDKDVLRQWGEYVRHFQTSSAGKFPGLFEDKAILRRADLRNGWFWKDIATRRAETRQACAALLGAGTTPKWPVGTIPTALGEVEKYFNGLPWDNDPWRAGSHVSHLVFFLKLNADVFDQKEYFKSALPVIIKKLDKIQDVETGSWFKGHPSSSQIINAAMKILTLYALLNRPFKYPERLIDYCLANTGDRDGCHIVDAIYVLYRCNKLTDYRQGDISDFVGQKLAVIEKHLKPDGAFSFGAEKTSNKYYGVKVAKGYHESDFHGTYLLLWAVTMISELVGFSEELGFNLPVT